MPQKIVTTIRSRRRRRQSNRVVKRVVTKSKQKRRKSRKQKQTGVTESLLNSAKLISNPCHGPLTRTIGDGAVTERVRTSFNVPSVATDVCGYVAWFPTYHNGGIAQNSSNVFSFENSASSVAPTNTTANPLGMVAVNTTGFSRPDPAYTVLAGASFARAKAHSACLQLEYVGKLSDVSGQVAIIKNIPFRAMFSNTTTPVLAAPTVDKLFAYAAERERLQITGHELTWRPTDLSSVFRTPGNERPYSLMTSGGVAPDTAWTNGSAASATSNASSIDADEMYGICIAWKGLPATAGCLAINLVKVISLELAPSGDSIESPVIAESSNNFNPVNTVTGWLDKYSPGWQSKAVNSTVNVAGALAKAYAPKAINIMSNGLRGRQQLLLQN